MPVIFKSYNFCCCSVCVVFFPSCSREVNCERICGAITIIYCDSGSVFSADRTFLCFFSPLHPFESTELLRGNNNSQFIWYFILDVLLLVSLFWFSQLYPIFFVVNNEIFYFKSDSTTSIYRCIFISTVCLSSTLI